MRIGILTGGGDVPGLNAAIRAVARQAFDYGWEVYGIYDGWKGLRDGIIGPLKSRDVSGILHRGGTILGSSRTNIAKKPEDMEQAIANIQEFGLDAIVAIGGDDTLGVCAQLVKRGVPAVGIPKTMDNDVYGTDYCIGFNSAVTRVADALDKLHTTAESHHRVIIVEVMGRYTGWVAVMGGLAGGADYIFIPEKPSSIAEVCEHIKRRWERGKKFSIVVVAEAADIAEVHADEAEAAKHKDEFGHVRRRQGLLLGDLRSGDGPRRAGPRQVPQAAEPIVILRREPHSPSSGLGSLALRSNHVESILQDQDFCRGARPPRLRPFKRRRPPSEPSPGIKYTL